VSSALDTSVEQETIDNTGYACIGSDGDDNHDTALVTVVLSECLPSCSWDEEATCTASTVGDTVTVTSSGRYAVGFPDDSDCPSICIQLDAICPVDGLADGSFTLLYAGAEVDFTAPVTGSHCTGA